MRGLNFPEDMSDNHICGIPRDSSLCGQLSINIFSSIEVQRHSNQIVINGEGRKKVLREMGYPNLRIICFN